MGLFYVAGNQDIISWSDDGDTDCLSMKAIAGAPASSDSHIQKIRQLDVH